MGGVGLTSGISWTLVVDRLSSRGALPGHCEKVLFLTNLVRSFKKEKKRREVRLREANRHVSGRACGGGGGAGTRYESMFSLSISVPLHLTPSLYSAFPHASLS